MAMMRCMKAAINSYDLIILCDVMIPGSQRLLRVAAKLR